jgi:glycine cleavage system regulatory protein
MKIEIKVELDTNDDQDIGKELLELLAQLSMRIKTLNDGANQDE